MFPKKDGNGKREKIMEGLNWKSGKEKFRGEKALLVTHQLDQYPQGLVGQ